MSLPWLLCECLVRLSGPQLQELMYACYGKDCNLYVTSQMTKCQLVVSLHCASFARFKGICIGFLSNPASYYPQPTLGALGSLRDLDLSLPSSFWPDLVKATRDQYELMGRPPLTIYTKERAAQAGLRKHFWSISVEDRAPLVCFISIEWCQTIDFLC